MKRFNKFVSMLTVLCLLAMCMLVGVSAAGATVAVGSVEGEAGKTIEIPVTLAGNPGVNTAILAFSYDTSALELTAIDNGDLGFGTFQGNPSAAVVVLNNANNIEADGTLCYLTFAVKDSAAVGSYDVDVTWSDDDPDNFSNADYDAVAVTFAKGSVTVPCTNHEFGDWTVTKDATCDAAGSRTRTCKVCGSEETESIPALGHKWSAWETVKDATCTEAGSQTRTCDTCGKAETKAIPALGHDWGEWEVVKEATESEEGLQQRVCKNDPSHVEEEVIPVVKPVPTWNGVNYVLHEPEMPEGNPLPAPEAPAPEAPAPEAPAPAAPAPEAPAPAAPAPEAPAPEAPAYAGFSDVDESLWYGTEQQGVIKAVVELGIMNGYPDGTFRPNDNIKLSEAITMAARVVDAFMGSNADFTAKEGEAWYAPYVAYLESAGLLNAADFGDLEAPATRGQMAQIFGAAAAALPAINDVSFDYIPDVDENTPNGAIILALYQAGVLTGDAGSHAFRPDDNVTRAEAAAIIARVAVPEARQAF